MRVTLKLVMAMCAMAVLFVASGVGTARASGPIKVTIGYQSLWAACGEIFETLRHTNILELNGISAQFKTFPGASIAEAMVAGAIDNIMAADIPTLRALSRVPGSTAFHRTCDSRYGIIVQPNFQGTLADLRGKKISGPFATSVFPRSMRVLMEGGIKDPFRETSLINQDLPEQASSLQSGLVDAVVTWDPTMYSLTSRKIGKVLWMAPAGQVIGWQGFTARWLKDNGPDGLNRFLKAWIMATWWTSHNLEKAHGWFASTSRLEPEVLKVSADYDRNLAKPIAKINETDVTISETDLDGTQKLIEFLVERKLLTARLDARAYYDPEPLKRALREIANGKHPDLNLIRVTSK